MLTNFANGLQHYRSSFYARSGSGATLGIHGHGEVEADVVRVENALVEFKIEEAAVKVVVVSEIQIAVAAGGVIALLRDWVCESERVGREHAESGGETFALRHVVVAHGSHDANRVTLNENHFIVT